LAGSTPVLDGVLMPSVSLLLTKREAASELRISVRQIERIVAADRLRTVRVGRAVRIRRGDLDAYVASLAGGGTFRDHVEEKTP
jgi:excisionase family DNA binding protein